MSRVVRSSPRRPVPAPTATYKVTFGRRNGANNGKAGNGPPGRIPRVTRLLALAHRIDGMIRIGDLKDWAEAARLVGVTRARMTQIANMLLLAPEIQESILNLSLILRETDPLTEHNLRAAVALADWELQKEAWKSGNPSPWNPDDQGPEYS